jgi:leucine dehydrogenase
VDEAKVARLLRDVDAEVVSPDEVLRTPADVLAPCALGGVLNDATVPHLRAEVVAGAANNQLQEERHASALVERGILYTPDFVANSGGVLSGAAEILGWSARELEARIDAIYDTVTEVFAVAASTTCTPEEAANRLAEGRLASAR